MTGENRICWSFAFLQSHSNIISNTSGLGLPGTLQWAGVQPDRLDEENGWLPAPLTQCGLDPNQQVTYQLALTTEARDIALMINPGKIWHRKSSQQILARSTSHAGPLRPIKGVSQGRLESWCAKQLHLLGAFAGKVTAASHSAQYWGWYHEAAPAVNLVDIFEALDSHHIISGFNLDILEQLEWLFEADKLWNYLIILTAILDNIWTGKTTTTFGWSCTCRTDFQLLKKTRKTKLTLVWTIEAAFYL